MSQVKKQQWNYSVQLHGDVIFVKNEARKNGTR
jgi:hypothetical protein